MKDGSASIACDRRSSASDFLVDIYNANPYDFFYSLFLGLMKLIITLFVLLATSSVFACTDFTGTFRNSDGSIFSLAQSACSSVMLTQDGNTQTIISTKIK